MFNKELSKIFYEIADFLEMDKIAFRPYAYRRAALAIESLDKDIKDIYNQGGIKALEEIPSIGKNISERIEEYLKTGKIDYHKRLRKKIPSQTLDLVKIEGLGLRKVKVLYEKLNIKNIKDLEKAAKSHKIAPLFGFGAKTEGNILEGISFLKKNKGRFLLGEILPLVKEIKNNLEKIKGIKKADWAGSTRRMKETIGDVDFLVASNKPDLVMGFFASLPNIAKVLSKGKTKTSIKMKTGLDIDVRVVLEKSYGSALQYFTGSKEHNIALRKIAISKGFKLSEYGLFKGSKMVAGKNEEGIYKMLGLSYVPPEIRENQGEIEVFSSNPFSVINVEDIQGDLHCHSNWNGGELSIKELTKYAIDFGYKYLGIADHTKFLRIEKGLNEKQLILQAKEIEKINKSLSGFRVLHGCEANIMTDGSLDIKDSALSKLDYVIAGIHSSFKISKEKMTARIIRSMENPNVDIISHPTGRILQRRDEYEIDLDKILKAAKRTNTILEINSHPERLDLNDINIKRAKDMGVKMVINADVHSKNHFGFIEFGVAQAKRGWLKKQDVINTGSLKELVKHFK